MKTKFDQFKLDLQRLSSEGVSLFNAMQNELYPDRMQEHISQVLKKDYNAFKNSLPSFSQSYQKWYSEAQIVIKILLPERLLDFNRLYEPAKTRKDVKLENYVIEDYFKNVTITTGFDKKLIVGPIHAIPVFQQQLNILNAVHSRFESTFYDIHLHLQVELFDAELVSVESLIKNKHYRSAAIICGNVLEKFLQQVCHSNMLKLSKRNPSINEYNDVLKKQEVYDFYTWRSIQGMGDFVKNCLSIKKPDPLQEDVMDLLEGVTKVIRIFL